MPVWDTEPEWFFDALDSALGQTDCDVEIVVVDDGCEPPLAPAPAHRADPRLSLVRVPHGGISRARNAGLEVARGQYVRFIDSDDVIAPDSTARLLDVAAGADDVIAYGVTVRCNEALEPIEELRSHLSGPAIEPCLLGRFPARHMSMLFPSAVVEKAGAWDDTFSACGDWDFVLRALEHAELQPGDFVATYYRSHPGMTCASLDRTVPGMRLVVDRYLERHPEARSSHLVRRARANVERKLAYEYLLLGERRRAARLQFGAFLLTPVETTRATIPIFTRLSTLAARKLTRIATTRIRCLVAAVR